MLELLAVLGIIFVGFILFCVYFIFKQIEYVLVSANLFRQIVQRQETMVSLLVDIRDSTKKYVSSSGEERKDGTAEPTQMSEVQEEEPENGDAESVQVSEFEKAEQPAYGSVCSRCGKPWPPESHFCPNCGAQAEEVAEDEAQQALFCYHCGAELPGDVATCPKCRKKL